MLFRSRCLALQVFRLSLQHLPLECEQIQKNKGRNGQQRENYTCRLQSRNLQSALRAKRKTAHTLFTSIAKLYQKHNRPRGGKSKFIMKKQENALYCVLRRNRGRGRAGLQSVKKRLIKMLTTTANSARITTVSNEACADSSVG